MGGPQAVTPSLSSQNAGCLDLVGSKRKKNVAFMSISEMLSGIRLILEVILKSELTLLIRTMRALDYTHSNDVLATPSAKYCTPPLLLPSPPSFHSAAGMNEGR